MKKILALMLALMMVMGVMASCFQDVTNTTTTTTGINATTTTNGTPATNNGTSTTTNPGKPICNVHVNNNNDNVCDNCGEPLEDPTPSECVDHKDDNTDFRCDNCGAVISQPNVPVEGSINITLTGFSFETIYCEWTPLTGADSYNVYCNGIKVDTELIRNYGTYYRCDILGLKAGEYTIDVYAVDNGQEVASTKTSFKKGTIAHAREGFGFVGGSASGAYNDDGTLKSNAQVIYVTATNAKTVTATVNGATQTGLQTILDAKEKKNTSNDVLCIRVIGMISLSDLDHISSSAEGLQIKGNAANTEMNITFEGVGNDATINGFGFLIRNCKNVEIRNIGIMNFMDDGISVDTNNSNLWIHNVDFFYGKPGSAADQAKGDGSLDVKKSQYITLSYNHFFDSGKCCLLDASTGEGSNYITYHHNWFDHSDSRHPRVRNANVHVYNNYYDGVAKYGIGAAGGGSSVFSEANYFENTKYPMLTAMQGSDILSNSNPKGTFSGEDGGVIKSFGDVIVGGTFRPYSSTNNVEYDAYVATSRNEVLPSSITSKKGGHTYSNFDTDSSMYTYTPQTAQQAKENVMNFAGRVQGGDFKWTFTDADNDSSDIDTALKSALVNYKSTLVSTNVGNTANGGNSGNDNGGSNSGNDTPVVTPTPEGAIVHNFTTDDKTSSFFTISGNTSKDKGTVEYNGLTLTQCLKIESSTNITFTIDKAMTLTLVFVESSTNIKVDGEKITSNSNAIVIELESGAHTITKADTMNLFYIVLE